MATNAAKYGGADKSLARITSLCILFDGKNISFDVWVCVCVGFVLYGCVGLFVILWVCVWWVL